MTKYLLSVFILFLAKILTRSHYHSFECVSVPPGGVSGFWYSISKLKKYNHHSYYCASSGCLAVISSKINPNDVYNLAKTSRERYKTFSEIKNNFISLLINKLHFLPNVTIATMTKYGTCIDTTPKNKKELKALLIKTTDVPFLAKNTNHEIDGGLCYHYMNNCKYKITLPITYKFISNLFNYNIKDSDVIYFYTFS